MRIRTTIILLLVLIGLGIYVYQVEMPKVEQEAKKKTLTEFKVDDVTEVSLVYPDREIVLQKDGANWRMTKPVDAPADAQAVKNIVEAVTNIEVAKELGDASELVQYGLDKPLVTVTVKVGEKELPAILVGKSTPVGSNAYVKRADSKAVVLTGSAFRTTVDKQPKDLRDKTILTFADADVRKIRLEGDGQDIVLAQKDNQWWIESPAAHLADTTAVRSLVSALRSLRAVDFPAEHATDVAAFGLDTPRLKVTLVTGADGAETTLVVGKENEEKQVYLQRGDQPVVYAVNDSVLRDLNKGVDDLRDKTLLAFDRDKVGALQISSKHGKTKLVRGDDKLWKVEGVDGKPLQATVNQYLADVHELKGYAIAADQVADVGAFGLDQPQVAITVFGEGTQEIGTVLLGQRAAAEGKTENTAMKTGATTVYLVRDFTATRLNKGADAFVEKEVPPGATAPVGTPAGDIGFDRDDL